MGWLRMMFLGNIGQQMDIEEQRSELERLHAHASQGHAKDAQQDHRLLSLEAENVDLKLCLVELAKLLIAKGVLDRAEIEHLVDDIDPPESGQEPC